MDTRDLQEMRLSSALELEKITSALTDQRHAINQQIIADSVPEHIRRELTQDSIQIMELILEVNGVMQQFAERAKCPITKV